MEMHKKGELVLEDIREEDGDIEGDMFQGITLKDLDRKKRGKKRTTVLFICNFRFFGGGFREVFWTV